MKDLFIAWVPYQRRTESMQSFFGWSLTYFGFQSDQRLLRPLEYIVKFLRTIVLLAQTRPRVLWVQIAPTPLLYAAHLYRALARPRPVVIADCHSSVFRFPWIKTPGLRALLNRTDMVLVHNAITASQAAGIGVDPSRILILEDRPASIEGTGDVTTSSAPRPWILHPNSFAEDEPVAEVFAAAKSLPDVTFLVTGRIERARGRHDLSTIPANVRLTQFLPTAEYEQLLRSADAVLGLTLFDGVQLSVANEAVGAGTPMVLSDTKVLRELFDEGAVYVDSRDPVAIARGVKEALSNHQTLRAGVQRLKERRDAKWQAQGATVSRRIREACEQTPAHRPSPSDS
jgi:glycosyltransferase involved in cell wall biosynthesis